MKKKLKNIFLQTSLEITWLSILIYKNKTQKIMTSKGNQYNVTNIIIQKSNNHV